MDGFRRTARSDGPRDLEAVTAEDGAAPGASAAPRRARRPGVLSVIASLTVLVVVLAGCGSDDGNDAAVKGASEQVEAFCTELHGGDVDLGFDREASVGDLNAKFLALERNAPPELKSDLSTITASLGDLRKALADSSDGENMPLESAIAAAKFDDPGFEKAVRNVQSFAKEKCTG